jgi:hypothetical protein
MRVLAAALFALACATAATTEYSGELIFPLEKWHNHSSSVVELPNGDLLVVWFHGSGERTADDVKIEGARLARGAKTWSPRMTLADTPNFPDANPAMFVDRDQRLWLLWPVIMANEWHTALMKYKIAKPAEYNVPGVPKWSITDEMLFIPRNFEATVKRVIEPQMTSGDQSERAIAYRKRILESMLLSTNDAARRIGIAAATLRGWAVAGRIPAQRLSNGERIYDSNDVDRIATERHAAAR